MSLFEDLSEIDILGPIASGLNAGKYTYSMDGKLRFAKGLELKVDSPWIDTKIALDRHCGLWHIIYFNEYRLVSRNCFNCWKIVVRPKTLKDLFGLYEIQQKMGLPSKCGAERRTYATHKGWYAGFWYCPMQGGLEGAREFHKTISYRVKDALGIQTPVTLKRACTEFEDFFGPSDLWEYPDAWARLEDLLESVWEVPCPDVDPMTSPMKVAITRVWIDWARQHGDPTASDYTVGSSSFGVTDTVTYHDNNLMPKVNPPLTYRPWEEEDAGSAEIQRIPSE
jgi:hypothetical protein